MGSWGSPGRGPITGRWTLPRSGLTFPGPEGIKEPRGGSRGLAAAAAAAAARCCLSCAPGREAAIQLCASSGGERGGERRPRRSWRRAGLICVWLPRAESRSERRSSFIAAAAGSRLGCKEPASGVGAHAQFPRSKSEAASSPAAEESILTSLGPS
ncbi:Hypothetical predicted protein [Podarcis lilfordi]|uniref:Uncharacterized protein n=1 Tax=Podarcis lilfordi TaxID=74358 RepID=A0AA35JTR3_9SAUR|nr:Hypothetical predicted protein [Podarcis lilfordi]